MLMDRYLLTSKRQCGKAQKSLVAITLSQPERFDMRVS